MPGRSGSLGASGGVRPVIEVDRQPPDGYTHRHCVRILRNNLNHREPLPDSIMPEQAQNGISWAFRAPAADGAQSASCDCPNKIEEIW